MTDYDRLRITYARLHGEYAGTLQGILLWDIPMELKKILKKKYDELNNGSEKEFAAEN